ncbi:MAG TPA: DUF6356 family protein [Croceibacterium sp.]|nr:DUF6356 family protein [Croceibacterium sp.]
MANPVSRLFTEHPRSVGESYAEHFEVAAGVGLAMLGGALACFVHALVPGLFQRTGSATIKRLYAEIVRRQPNGPRLAHEDPAWQVEYEI